MKYYSDVLDTMFDTPEELEKAEANAKAKDVEKEKARAKVNDLYNDFDMAKERAAELKEEADNMIIEAESRLDEAMKTYCEKYGPIIIGKCKYTGTDKDDVKCSICDEDYHDRLTSAEKKFNEVIGDLLDIFRI